MAPGRQPRLGPLGNTACSTADGPSGEPNPFAVGNAHFLVRQRSRPLSATGYAARGQRPGSARPAVPAQGGAKSSTASAAGPARRLEHSVLQALERLEKRDTLELGARQLRQVLAGLRTEEELSWFLRVAFDERHPLASARARREQLLLLPAVVRHFGAEASRGAVDRVLGVLVGALRHSDAQEAARAACELLDDLAPEGGGEGAGERLAEACRALLRALLEPLVLGAGWDTAVRGRCVSVLVSLTPAILHRAQMLLDDPSITCLLQSYATWLVQALAANPQLQEGLLQCLAQMAAESSRSVLPHAHRLVELCASHLALTPSAVPDCVPKAQAAEDHARSESPRRGTLTRELALVCCLCLKHLAGSVAPLMSEDEDLMRHRPTVEAALGRDNLNLQRLTRSNEPLRQAIAHAWQVWQDPGNYVPEPDAGPGTEFGAAGPLQRDRAFSSGAQLRSLARPLLQEPVADGRPWRRCVSPGCGRRPRRSGHARGRHGGPRGCERAEAGAAEGHPCSKMNAQQKCGAARVETSIHQEGASDDALGEACAGADVSDCTRPRGPRNSRLAEMLAAQGSLEEALDDRTSRRLPMQADGSLQWTIHPSQLVDKPQSPTSMVEAADVAQLLEPSIPLQSQVPKQRPGGGAGPVPRAEAVDPLQRTASTRRIGPDIPDARQRQDGSTQVSPGQLGASGAGRMPAPSSGPAPAPPAPPPPPEPAAPAPVGAAGPMAATGPPAPRSGAGPVPAAEPPAVPVPSAEVARVQELPEPCWSSPLDGDAPYLSTALEYIASGQLDQAFRCVFQLGNERTLRAVLRRRDCAADWLRLPDAEARYLAHLLARLLIKDPFGPPAHEACAWLEGLLRAPGGSQLLAAEDFAGLQGALFSLSGTACEAGHRAASVYYKLFQEPALVA